MSWPEAVETMAAQDFDAYELDTPVRDPNAWADQFAGQAMGMHLADKILRMSKVELVAFIRGAGEKDADLPESLFRVLDAAQETFEGYGKLLDTARTRYTVAASAAVTEQAAKGEA